MNKFKKIINKSIKNVQKTNVKSIPKIYDTYYYGNFTINPGLLVIVYIFKTDLDLKVAIDNGLIKQIESETKKNLLDFGYPRDKFEEKEVKISKENFFDKLNNPKVKIKFISNQRVQEESNGILFDYLKSLMKIRHHEVCAYE